MPGNPLFLPPEPGLLERTRTDRTTLKAIIALSVETQAPDPGWAPLLDLCLPLAAEGNADAIVCRATLLMAKYGRLDTRADVRTPLSTEDWKDIFSMIKPLGDQGHVLAQACIGELLINDPTRVTDDAAVSWLEHAAAQGSASAALNLGALLVTGRFTSSVPESTRDVSPARLRELYTLAASAFPDEARYNIALLDLDHPDKTGREAQEGREELIRLADPSRQPDHPVLTCQATRSLAWAYLNGRGGPRQHLKGQYLRFIAAAQRRHAQTWRDNRVLDAQRILREWRERIGSTGTA